MNVENGTEAAQFQEKEYVNGIFLAVCKGPGHIQWMQGNTFLGILPDTKYLLHIFVITGYLGLTTMGQQGLDHLAAVQIFT
jgi:hypothetical protein